MKLFAPPNNETVVDVREHKLKRSDVLKDRFSTAPIHDGVTDNNMGDVLSD